MQNIKEKVEGLLIEAGKLLFTSIGDKSMVEEKGFANYVTEVDYKVQELLTEKLTEIIPGSNIIGEESKHNIFDIEKPTWIVDPVDGTTNLMYGYKHSAISVGLYKENAPYMGFIYNPYLKEMFFAETGKGAYLNDVPIKVTKNSTMEECLAGFGTNPYDRSNSDKTFEIVTNLFKRCRDLRRTGSAALDIAYVACGRIDLYFEMNLQPWDYAAGFVILSEAGGKTTDWHGEAPKFTRPSSIVCSNGALHEEMLEIIHKSYK
jgi:myo-inositol-1(or 4)-monophosphatase